jgi:hypothetical protein
MLVHDNDNNIILPLPTVTGAHNTHRRYDFPHSHEFFVCSDPDVPIMGVTDLDQG